MPYTVALNFQIIFADQVFTADIDSDAYDEAITNIVLFGLGLYYVISLEYNYASPCHLDLHI